MVKELVVYPDDRILLCSDVRDFKDESLPRLLNDMKETMQEYKLTALSAIQVAHPFNIVIVKKDDEYWELINPRILGREGNFINKETTSYYPDIELEIPRYETIQLIYEDRDGKSHSIKITDKQLSATIQRKIDYLSGGTPLDRLDKKYRQKVLDALAGKGLIPCSGDVCPTFSKKDYIISFLDKILFFMGLSLLTPIFKNLPKNSMTPLLF